MVRCRKRSCRQSVTRRGIAYNPDFKSCENDRISAGILHFYFWQWHLLQLLARPLGKATNAIARAKGGVSPDTRAKAAIPARIVSPTSTSVELLAGGCVATDPTQPAWREGARTPDR